MNWWVGIVVVLSALLFISASNPARHERNNEAYVSRYFSNPLSKLGVGGKQRNQNRRDSTELPPGWARFEDQLTKQPYYFDSASGIVTWESPSQNLASSLPDCKADMVKSAYTRCDAITSTRSLAFFHTQPCKKGVPLPPTVMGLPCNNSCTPGQYLPLGRPHCEPCAAGSYSVGDGVFFTNWEKFPVGMTSYCRFQLEADRFQQCSAWILNGTFIESGAMRGKRLVDSILEYKVELIRGGLVMFEFRVDAERRWDGLYFAVDGKRTMEMVSYQFQFAQFRVPLDAGFHTLQWIYHKDVAYEMGEDKAWIRSIEVLGTQANMEYCNVCPAGRFSNAGAAHCNLCPTNTFASTSGSSACSPCNAAPTDQPHLYSYPGAKACSPSAPCIAEDITFAYGPCDESTGRRMKRFSYKQPQICFGGVSPPADEEVTCALCDPGMFREGSRCDYCPPGTFNSNATSSGSEVCTVCPPGSVAKKVEYLHKAFDPEQFQQLVADGVVSTGCANGFCGQDGWRPLGDSIDTGVGNGQVADIWLALEVLLETDGEVSVKFSRRATNMENVLQMYVDDRRMWSIETMQAMADNDEPLQFRAEVPAGEHTITWVFHKEREYNWMQDPAIGAPTLEDRAIISEILVTGVAVGGAVACASCPAGSISDASSSICLPCPSGFAASAPGQPACFACEAGTFSPVPGAVVCQPCGHGTGSRPAASACDVSPWQCRYSLGEDVMYDLGGLARPSGPMWGPVLEDNASMSYFINVCSRGRSNTTCQGRDGAGLDTLACQEATVADELHGSQLAVSLGDVQAFYTLEDDPEGGLILAFEHGTPCSDGRQRALNVTMLCDPSAGPGAPELPSDGGAVENSKCRYRLEWQSQFACRLCTERDMEAIPGECSLAGKRPVNLAWREPRRCHGGAALPPPRSEDCVAVVLDRTNVAIIVLSSAAVFLLLCLALVVLYLRNRKIYREYTVLKEQNEADMELERYTLDEDDA